LLFLLTACSGNKAEHYYQEALALADEGDAPQALEHFRMAADHSPSDTLLVAIYSDMGQLLFAEGLQEDALAAFSKAYEVDVRLGDTLGMACDLRDMANVYRTREADDSCLVLFSESMRLAESMGDADLVLDVGSQLAGYHLWHGRYDEARRLLMPALNALPDNAGLRFMAADLYRHTGPRDSAYYYCRGLLNNKPTSNPSGGEGGGLLHRQMAHKWLAELLMAEGHTQEAMTHLEQYELLTDSVQQEIDTEALRRTNALYDYSRRARQNARLQVRLAVAVAAVVALVALLLASAFWYSRRRLYYRLRVQQLEQLLSDHRRRDEQTTERQQQILTQTPIYRRIVQLLSDTAPKPLTDEDWHILADTIDKTHPDFTRHLNEFHRLTPQELRITLLIKAGIAPADIARLTSRSKQSVSSTRSRLFLKVFGRKGTPAEWDEFVATL
jgi:tetratricopeptide (TPR) repeat protein